MAYLEAMLVWGRLGYVGLFQFYHIRSIQQQYYRKFPGLGKIHCNTLMDLFYYIFLVAVWFKDVFRFFNWGKIHPIRFFSVGLERTTYNVDPYQFEMGLRRPLIGVIATFIIGRGPTLEFCYDCFQFLLARRDLGNWYQLHPVYTLKRKSRPFTKIGLQKQEKNEALNPPFVVVHVWQSSSSCGRFISTCSRQGND